VPLVVVRLDGDAVKSERGDIPVPLAVGSLFMSHKEHSGKNFRYPAISWYFRKFRGKNFR
jgi:hypothetical protein